jgi:pimeloyl-ACP methyl ester carboxylesterase
MRRFKRIVLGVAGLVSVAALIVFEPWVSHPSYAGPVAKSHARGSVESVQYLDGYSKWELRGLIKLAGLPSPVPVDNGVELYRLRYWTEHLGKPALVSGLFVLPRGSAPRATVMWSHGTSVLRSSAPSNPSEKPNVFIAAAFAGSGFLTVAPDLVGMGQSTIYHPYLYVPTTVAASIDMLRAAKTVSEGMKRAWKPSLYLVGFSQGGLTTAAVQRELQTKPDSSFEVKAAAAISPPLNLAEITFPHALKGQSEASSLYAGYILSSYSQVYKQPANSVFLDKYASLLPKLYNGNMQPENVEAALPRDTRSMFQPSFLEGFENGESSWFRDALIANEGHNWAPQVLLKLFVGSKDVDVPAEDAITAAAEMKAANGNVAVVKVGPYTHNEVVERAVPQAQAWFRTLASSKEQLPAKGAAQ